MKKLIAFLLAALMLLSLAACGGNSNSNQPSENSGTPGQPDTTEGTATVAEPVKGGVVKYCWTELSPTFDPYGQAAWTTYIWANNIFENCLVRGEDGVIYPMVCEYELSEDSLQLKLWIREGVKFSDGTPVTLDDVVASLQRAALFTPRVQTLLWDLTESYTIENDVLTFVFSQYNVGTIEIFCSPRPCYGGIMPKAICEKYGSKLINDPNDCIGTGPYKLDAADSIAGSRYSFTRNDNYTVCEASPEGNGLASPKRQYLDGLLCVVNNDVSSQLMSLMNGELNILEQGDDRAYKASLEGLGYTEHTYNADGAYYMFFNCSEDRPVADVNLRKAIATVLDFDEVIYTAYGSNYDPDLSSPMQCGSAYDTDAFTSQDWYGDRKSNLELAKKYLDASDYNGEELQLIVSMSAVSAVILEDLQSIGINCDRQSLDNQTMIAYANDGSLDWDIIVRANPISYIYPTEMNSTFYNNWHNQQGEALMETLGTMPTGSAESVACWQELASLMAEEVPFVIFGGQYEYDIMSPGLVPNRQGNWRVWYNAYWTE